MIKTYKSFNEIAKNLKNFEAVLDNPDKYWGHTHSKKENEKLFDHINKTQHYFLLLVKKHGLENIIDKLISEINFGNSEIGNYIKKLFMNAVVFHDFGKINPNFQFERLKNNLFKKDKSIKIGYEHSFLSAYIFLNYHSFEINKNNIFSSKNKYALMVYTFLFTIPILKHHSNSLIKDYNFDIDKILTIHQFLSTFNIKLPFELTKNLIKSEPTFWQAVKNKIDFFPLFALIKLNWSLLTASDYYATSDYMNDLKLRTKEDFGLIDDELKKNIFRNFEEKKDFNKKLIQNPDYYLNYSIKDLLTPNNDNLNLLRQKLGAEVLKGVEKYRNEHIFYIEAPTGGGKTNMSMIAVRKLLEMHSEINKVFYVFPFTTLITQTAKSIKDTLGLTEQHVAQIHSKAGLQTKNHNYEEDAKYGNELKNYIDNLFVNYPFALLTHIKFFDILKSNSKNANYLLHRLANSVVIIDELQAYSPEHWDKIKYFIANYAKYFNIRFIIMSATLPKIDGLTLTGEEFTEFQELIPNAQEDYLQNPNFAERVNIKTDLLDKKDIELPELAEIVLEKSKKYAANRTDEYKNSVYTIIEFIFKKSASEFYDIIKEKHKFFDKIFVLSGTIIEPRRKYIIEFLKDENNRHKKILLITTQVVEAGVDIDMDLGFKNQSLLDSDEQLAGRINRNVKKQNCELWLFKINEPFMIYGKDERYKVTKLFSNETVKDILQNKKFDYLYKEVIRKIDKDNKSAYKDGFNEYKNYFSNLNFDKIHSEFKLIDSKNATIFVPEDIDVNCYGDEKNFSNDELKFIEKHNCFSEENTEQVSGEKIWDLYVNLVQNKNISFNKKQIEMKILNGIMSKFVFSIFAKNVENLREYFDYQEDLHQFETYQYYKFRNEVVKNKKIYSLKSGLNLPETKKTCVFF